jgi:hypothetical protein
MVENGLRRAYTCKACYRFSAIPFDSQHPGLCLLDSGGSFIGSEQPWRQVKQTYSEQGLNQKNTHLPWLTSVKGRHYMMPIMVSMVVAKSTHEHTSA